MKNLWNQNIANFYVKKYAKKKISKDLALRIYTTHLLGSEKKLVLHGGGNTSLKETQKEEDLLQKKSDQFEKLIEERLINAYKRIRGSVKNGLAIVAVERGASGGSYFTIPPQVQLEIASRNKIIMDEHSGRILVDAELAKEESEKIQKLIGK